MIGAEALLVDGERAPHQGLGVLEPVRGLQELRQIVEADGDVWVIGAEALLVDGERAPHQGLGVFEPVGGLQELRQIVEVAGDVRVILAERFLVDRKRAPHQGLGVLEPVGGLQELRQIVEVGWRRLGDRGRGFVRRWRARAASRARRPRAGWWLAGAPPDC